MQPGLFKLRAALHGLTFIQSGMIVGLGAGSTAILAVRGLGEKLAQGELRDIRGIPCSRQIEAEARRVGIPLTTLEDDPVNHDITFQLDIYADDGYHTVESFLGDPDNS